MAGFGGDTEFQDLDGAVDEVNLLTGCLREVDQEICAFSWGDKKVGHLDGRREQPLIAADLMEWLAIGEGQVEEAAVGGVEEAEAVEARLDFEEGAHLAIEEDAAAAELGYPGVFGVAGVGIVELAVGGELAVVDQKRNFVFAGGKVERVLSVVA